VKTKPQKRARAGKFKVDENAQRKFMDDAGRSLADFSVAFGYSKKGNAYRFNAIGSGVLVKRGNRFGILTARHCVHHPGPELQLGSFDGDTLYLVLQRGRGIVVQSQDVIERPLVTPTSKEFGPDLAFIEILSPTLLGSIKAIGSFWSLDKNPSKIAEDFGKIGDPFVFTGFPGVHQETKIEGNTVRHNIKHMTYYYKIAQDSIRDNDGWDYIEGNCWYGKKSELPETFGGVSGGGVWGLKASFNETNGLLKLTDYALVGIAFLETPIKNKKRRLRAHFIKSIYDLAWKELEQSPALNHDA